MCSPPRPHHRHTNQRLTPLGPHLRSFAASSSRTARRMPSSSSRGRWEMVVPAAAAATGRQAGADSPTQSAAAAYRSTPQTAGALGQQPLVQRVLSASDPVGCLGRLTAARLCSTPEDRQPAKGTHQLHSGWSSRESHTARDRLAGSVRRSTTRHLLRMWCGCPVAAGSSGAGPRVAAAASGGVLARGRCGSWADAACTRRKLCHSSASQVCPGPSGWQEGGPCCNSASAVSEI